MSRPWKIGKDLSLDDNVLDGFTFEEIITTVCCNSKHITEEAVRLAAKQIIEIHMQDYRYLLENNILAVVFGARKRRGMETARGGTKE